MPEYYLGEKKQVAIGYCSVPTCRMPSVTMIEGQYFCPRCADMLVRQLLETWGFCVNLMRDFGGARGQELQRNYG